MRSVVVHFRYGQFTAGPLQTQQLNGFRDVLGIRVDFRGEKDFDGNMSRHFKRVDVDGINQRDSGIDGTEKEKNSFA